MTRGAGELYGVFHILALFPTISLSRDFGKLREQEGIPLRPRTQAARQMQLVIEDDLPWIAHQTLAEPAKLWMVGWVSIEARDGSRIRQRTGITLSKLCQISMTPNAGGVVHPDK
jgi:hypothetical protein